MKSFCESQTVFSGSSGKFSMWRISYFSDCFGVTISCIACIFQTEVGPGCIAHSLNIFAQSNDIFVDFNFCLAVGAGSSLCNLVSFVDGPRATPSVLQNDVTSWRIFISLFTFRIDATKYHFRDEDSPEGEIALQYGGSCTWSSDKEGQGAE